MRILIVNSNTSDSVTQAVAAEAIRCCSKGTEIITETAQFGPSAIENKADAEIAAEATVERFQAHKQDIDAGIIACFSDPGLAVAKQLMPYPVIGIAEASIHAACMLANRFSIVTIAPTTVAPIQELVACYGKSRYLASVLAAETSVLGAHGDPEGTITSFRALVQKAVERDGAEIIILGGAVTAGMKRELEVDSAVPILDGVDCAIRMAKAFA